MTARTVIGGNVVVITAAEVGEAPEGPSLPMVDPPPDPSFSFPYPITAMTLLTPNTLAIACGPELYIVKVL